MQFLEKELKRAKQEYEELRQEHNSCCEEFKQEINLRIDAYNKLSRDFWSGKYCNAKFCTQLQAKEQECENQSERNGSINQPGTIGTEAALCTVGKTTHQRVGHHIKHTSHQHQHGSIGKRESEDIGKKQRESDRHHLPNDTAGSGIAQSISNFFL